MRGWPVLIISMLLAFSAPIAVSAGSQRVDAADRAFWDTIRNSNNPADYRAYLRGFPNGRFVGEADARLADLERRGRYAGDVDQRRYDRDGYDRDRYDRDRYDPRPPLAGPTSGYAPMPGPTGVRLTVMPAYRSGDPVAVRFDGLPPGTHELRIYPISSRGAGRRAIEAQRIQPRYRDGGVSSTGQIDFPPLPPGAYEARLYTREPRRGRDRLEVAATAQFQVGY